MSINGTTTSQSLDYGFGAIELGSVVLGLTLNCLTIPFFNRNKVCYLQ